MLTFTERLMKRADTKITVRIQRKGIGGIAADQAGALLLNKTVSAKTRSGRKFRFDISDYAITIETHAWELEAIANQIVSDKYRACEWDRNHPQIGRASCRERV